MNKATKINLLLQNVPKHIVITDKLLKQLNISNSLEQIYIKIQWLESIGYGASIRNTYSYRRKNCIRVISPFTFFEIKS
jgi:hypothetical protein